MTNKRTCRYCIHRERWECGSKAISYCNKIRSNRTFNVLRKVKCTDAGCDYFEGETEQINSSFISEQNEEIL